MSSELREDVLVGDPKIRPCNKGSHVSSFIWEVIPGVWDEGHCGRLALSPAGALGETIEVGLRIAPPRGKGTSSLICPMSSGQRFCSIPNALALMACTGHACTVTRGYPGYRKPRPLPRKQRKCLQVALGWDKGIGTVSAPQAQKRNVGARFGGMKRRKKGR